MQASSAIVTRFAPSPTGRLHLGHAFAALFAEQPRARGRWALPAAHRGYRPAAAAGRNSRPAYQRISPGSASPGRRRCAGNPNISANIARPSTASLPAACSIPASAAAARSRPRSPPPPARPRGRRGRSIPAPAAVCPGRYGRGASRRASPMRCASTAPRQREVAGPLSWEDLDRGAVSGRARASGRCRAGPARCTRQLPSGRHARRPSPGRDPGDAGRGSSAGHPCPSPAAGFARLGRARAGATIACC